MELLNDWRHFQQKVNIRAINILHHSKFPVKVMWLKNSVQHTAALTSGFRKCRWQQRLHLYVSPGWKETTRTLPLPELAAQFLVAGWKIIKPRVMFQKNILIISNPDVQDVGRNSIFLAAASPHSLLISPRYKWNKFLRLWDETTERNRITLIWTWTSRNPVTDNYRAGQKGFGQVSWMLHASSGRSDKQLQE